VYIIHKLAFSLKLNINIALLTLPHKFVPTIALAGTKGWCHY